MAFASFRLAKGAELDVDELVLRVLPLGDGITLFLQCREQNVGVLLVGDGGDLNDAGLRGLYRRGRLSGPCGFCGTQASQQETERVLSWPLCRRPDDVVVASEVSEPDAGVAGAVDVGAGCTAMLWGDGLKPLKLPVSPVELPARVCGCVERRPRAYPMPKKRAQTSTSAKKMLRMTPMLSVISRSRSWPCTRCSSGGSCVMKSSSRSCGPAFIVAYSFAAGLMPSMVLFSRVISSMGNGNTMVVFFSTPMSVSVCR